MIDPQTGYWVDEISHSPGPGGSTGMGGAMDLMNALRGRNLAGQADSNRLLSTYMNINKNPETFQSFSQTPEGSRAMSGLGLSPETVNQGVQSSPLFQYHQALKGTEDFSPENVMKIGMQYDPEATKSMVPWLNQSMRSEQSDINNTRTNDTRLANELMTRASVMAGKLIQGGMAPDQAFRTAAQQELALSPMSEEYKKSVLQNIEKIATSGQVLPFVQARISMMNSQTGLNQAKTQQIQELTPLKAQNLMMDLGMKGAAIAFKQAMTALATGRTEMLTPGITATLTRAYAQLQARVHDNSLAGEDTSEIEGLAASLEKTINAIQSAPKAAPAKSSPAAGADTNTQAGNDFGPAPKDVPEGSQRIMGGVPVVVRGGRIVKDTSQQAIPPQPGS